ncbi:MAG: hypothetical protein R3F49_14770 [Planctomycetota bacterium]
MEAALLRDERESQRPLERSLIQAVEGLEPAFADALRAVVSPRRLAMLAGLLGVRPDADGMILNRMHGLALRVGPSLDDADLRRIRPYMESNVVFERIGAAQTLGALEDRPALPQLISLLRDDTASVRNSAHDSLRQISAMTMGPSHARWSAWFEREEAWWRDRGSRELGRLAAADRTTALSILCEAAHHRLYRDEIGKATTPLLTSTDPTIIRIALATLEGVRARGMELEIVDLLDHSSSSVRAQAATCLRSLTGQMLPPDARAWRKALTP